MLSQHSAAMSSEAENKLTMPKSGGDASLTAPGEVQEPPAAEGAAWDTRLDRMPLQLDVMVSVKSFRVGDLLALSRSGVLETVHEHAQDLPIRCGRTVLMWGEFEVVEQKLAVRITRLA
jgi:flagellar motor switch/type III secretory pathway protein FliN